MAHVAAATRLSSHQQPPVLNACLCCRRRATSTARHQTVKNPAMYGINDFTGVCSRCSWIAHLDLEELTQMKFAKCFGFGTATLPTVPPKYTQRNMPPSLSDPSGPEVPRIVYLRAPRRSSDGPAWRKQSAGVEQCHAILASMYIYKFIYIIYLYKLIFSRCALHGHFNK